LCGREFTGTAINGHHLLWLECGIECKNMMLFSWSLLLILTEAEGRPTANDETMKYVADLCRQLTEKQYLYAEKRWRDPLA